MKQLNFVLLLILLSSLVNAQAPNGYLTFGNPTDGTAATTANTGFGGVRIGTGGGGFVLKNPGQEIGLQGELLGTAPTGGSINSVGVTSTEFGTATNSFTVSFELYLTGGSSGTWSFFAGNGTSFASAQSSTFTGSQVFTGIQWVFGASNGITTNNRAGTAWVNIPNTPFSQNIPYTVTIVGNNSTSAINYGKNQSVGVNKYDLWVNGMLVGDDLAKAALTDASNINAFRFYGESSTGNAAKISLDNIKWWNSCVAPSVSSYSTLNTIPANAYSDVNIYSDATLAGSVDVQQYLGLNAGTLTTGGTLALKSSSNGTAKVGPVTGNISGDVTVERYITASSNRAFRLLAPSVTTTTSLRSNWQEGTNNPDVSTNNNPNPGYGTHITGTGGAANGFDETATNNTSLYTYDQATPAWVAVGNTNGTLDAKTGYLFYVRGDRSVDLTSASLPSTNTTLRATGALVVGPVSYTSLASDGGFSLVTNPYAAPLDWSLAYTGTNATNFENYYTYWDPNFGTRGAYVTVMTDNTTSVLGGASGTPAATKDIQSGQAFFLKTKAGISSPTFSVDEAYKGSNNNNNVFRTGSTEKFGVNLYFNTGAGLKLADGAVAVYSQNGNTAVDGNDAEEIASWDENIAIAREGKHLSIETRPLIDGNDNLPLFINHLKTQQYTLELVPVSFSASNISATLVDKYLQTRTPVSLSATTTVPFDVTNDAASSAPDRFTVEFSATSSLPVTLSNVKAYQKAQGIQVEWTAQSEVNMTGYEVEKSSDGRQFSKATSVAANGSAVYNWLDAAVTSGNNYYRIKATSRSGQIQYSQVVRVNLSKAGADITIYPNPVKGKVLSLQLNDVAKGKYSVAIFNSLGQQVFNKVIEHQGGSATETIQLDNTITKGIYQLRISGDGVSKTQQLIKE